MKHKDDVLKSVINDYVEWTIKVNDIFYSSKLDSCLYRIWYYKDITNPWRFDDLINERLFDYFTNKGNCLKFAIPVAS